MRRPGLVRAALAAAAVLLAVAALAAWSAREPAAPRWIALVDTSGSVRARHPDAPLRRRAELERWLAQASDAGAQVELWTLGPGIERRAGPLDSRALAARLDEPALFAPPPAAIDGTPLSTALARIEAAADVPAARIHWIGDASATGRDPSADWERLARAGCSVSSFEYGAPLVADVGIAALEPVEPWDGSAPLVATLFVSAESDAAVQRVRVTVATSNGGAWQREVELRDRESRALRIEFEPRAAVEGLVRLDARVERVDGSALGDAFAANDTLTRWVQAGPGARLAAVGFQDPLPRALHCLDERELPPLDALDGLLSRALPEGADAAARLYEWVRGGGVWFLLGADSAAGSSALDDARLRDALPLAPLRSSARRVRLCVDVSGSMEGAAFDVLRAAAVELVRRAPPGDRVEWCRFAAEAGPVELLREPGRADASAAAAALERVLVRATPAGATRMLAMLEQALAEPGEQRAALLFVLSDGRESGERAAALERAHALAARARELRVELVPIAAGAQADLELLGALGSAPLRADGERAALLTALATAVQREVAVRATQGALELAPVGPLGRALWPAGLGTAAFGAPGWSARVELRATAEAWLREAGAPSDETIGGLARVGSGWIVQLAWQPAASNWPAAWLTEQAARWPRRERAWAVAGEHVEWRAPAATAAAARMLVELHADGVRAATRTLELAFDPHRGAYTAPLPADFERELGWTARDTLGGELGRIEPDPAPEARLPVRGWTWPGAGECGRRPAVVGGGVDGLARLAALGGALCLLLAAVLASGAKKIQA